MKGLDLGLSSGTNVSFSYSIVFGIGGVGLVPHQVFMRNFWDKGRRNVRSWIFKWVEFDNDVREWSNVDITLYSLFEQPIIKYYGSHSLDNVGFLM